MRKCKAPYDFALTVKEGHLSNCIGKYKTLDEAELMLQRIAESETDSAIEDDLHIDFKWDRDGLGYMIIYFSEGKNEKGEYDYYLERVYRIHKIDKNGNWLN